MSDAQLIAALLDAPSTDQAWDLLQQAGDIGHLIFGGPAHLLEYGLSEREAVRFVIIPELFQRVMKCGDKRPVICSPFQAIAYLHPRCVGWTEERFGMLALNAKGEVLADRVLSMGTATGTLMSPREFFREALRYSAFSALAWHNHPSGDPHPSRADCSFTKRLRNAGDSLDVPLVDHIILGEGSNYSFREMEGWDG